MRVEKIETDKGERYILVNNEGNFVLPVVKYLKYRDNLGAARNTLRRIAYNLKLFYEFIEEGNTEVERMDVHTMSDFVAWLKKPAPLKSKKVIVLFEDRNLKSRSPSTVNYVIDDVMRYYEYLSREDGFINVLNEQLLSEVRFNSKFKRFLHHVSDKKKKSKSNALKQKVPKKKIKVLNDEQLEQLFSACRNIRDQFLLALLLESGMRIGEALSLHLADIDHARGKIHIVDRGTLENKAEIKTVGSERVIDCSQELTNLYSQYLLEVHDNEDVDTNYVFIKLSGKDRCNPMEYETVVGFINSLKTRTGINVNAHLYRHTSLTNLALKGMRPEAIQKRAGHKHIQTTLDFYTHFEEEDVRNEWVRVNQLKEKDKNL